MPNRHDWLSWDQYQAAHDSNMARFEAFVLESTLATRITPKWVTWEGRLVCSDGIELTVTKLQAIRRDRGRLEVRTEKYSYHVAQRRERPAGMLQILRYDNSHPHPRHPDAHHKHEWDAFGIERIVHVGKEGWPTLGDVIDEVERWWASPLVI